MDYIKDGDGPKDVSLIKIPIETKKAIVNKDLSNLNILRTEISKCIKLLLDYQAHQERMKKL